MVTVGDRVRDMIGARVSNRIWISVKISYPNSAVEKSHCCHNEKCVKCELTCVLDK